MRIHKKIKYLEKQDLKNRKEKLLASLQSVGDNVFLNGNTWVFNGRKKIVIGHNVHIGNNAFFAGHGGIIIGNNTHISRNVTIYTTNHDYNGKALPYDSKSIYKPVIINENVWIGMNVSIVPGVTIGKGAIIGLGTIVNRDIAAFEIVGTTKTKTLKYRDQEVYKDLNEKKQFGGRSGRLVPLSIIDNFKKTYSENRNEPIAFVLSTGRAGSLSIVDTLNQHPHIKAFHEDVYQLIRLSSEYAMEQDKKNSVLFEIQSIFESKIWQAEKSQLLIHSDQRLWNFIGFFNAYFPNATFIHLIRHPEACIKSMVARNWFHDEEFELYNRNDWALFRLNGGKTGDIPENHWQAMSIVERATWYWFYINSQIISNLSKLDECKVFYIETEKLNSKLKNLQSFLKISELELSAKQSNRVKNKDQEAYKKVDEQAIKNAILKISKMNQDFESLYTRYY
ncbi:sulfotransferase [Aequorivita sp. Q41]|uniref:sulfotransferase n=1 Tax=Aequorivita sp. Q41 TaxID=3153300 RepID=UPI0032427D30